MEEASGCVLIEEIRVRITDRPAFHVGVINNATCDYC